MVRGSFEHTINQAIVGKAFAIYNHLPKGAATATVAGKSHRSEQRDKCVVQSIFQVSTTQGMDGGASSWVALRTRGSTQQKHHRHYSIRTRVDRHGFRFLIWPVWVIHCELDRWRRSRRTLLGPWFEPSSGTHQVRPPWARVVRVALPRESLLLPLPGPALSGSPPLAGSALVGPPLALLSRGAGGPLSLFVPFSPFFVFLFCS